MNDFEARRAEAAIHSFTEAFYGELGATKSGPILHLLRIAESEAAHALIAMVNIDPANAAEIQKLQNLIHRHIDLVRWATQTVRTSNARLTKLTDMQKKALLEEIQGEHMPDIEDD